MAPKRHYQETIALGSAVDLRGMSVWALLNSLSVLSVGVVAEVLSLLLHPAPAQVDKFEGRRLLEAALPRVSAYLSP